MQYQTSTLRRRYSDFDFSVFEIVSEIHHAAWSSHKRVTSNGRAVLGEH